MKKKYLIIITPFIVGLFQISFLPAAIGQIQIDTAKTIATPDRTGSAAPIKNPSGLVSGFEKEEGKKKSAGDSTNILVAPSNTIDARLDSVQIEAWKSYYRYMNTGYKHRSNVFAWQLISSVIIFCIVLMLVLTGIYFAWLQFTLAMKNSTTQTSLSTEISASPKEIKLSSPVLGVIILVFSLLFFYLYLVYVYPITEIF